MATARSILLVTILSVAAFACSQGPGDAAEEFLRLVEAGEVNEAAKFVPALRQTLGDGKTLEALKRSGIDARAKGGLDKIEILKEEVHGDTAVVVIRTTFGNGKSEQEQLQMLRIGDQWTIQPTK